MYRYILVDTFVLVSDSFNTNHHIKNLATAVPLLAWCMCVCFIHSVYLYRYKMNLRREYQDKFITTYTPYNYRFQTLTLGPSFELVK